MNRKEHKLKLRENEVVEVKTFMESAMVCQLAHNLCIKWITGVSYLRGMHWSECNKKIIYSFHDGTYAHELKSYPDKICITATEWLNRHNIFVPGQKVITCCDNNGIYLGEGKAHDKYGSNKYFKSPYPSWESLNTLVPLYGKKYIKSELIEALSKIKPVEE